MSRWATIAFVVLCGLLLTGVLEPLTQGRDDSWVILLTPLGAVIGLAFGVRRWRALIGPVLLAAAAVLASGLDPLTLTLLAAVGLPVLLLVTALALAIAMRAPRHADRVAIVAFAVAVVPLVWGTADTVRRSTAPELPADVVERLPIEESLGNLCPGASTPPGVSRRLRRETEVLLRELREHPDSLVPYTYHYSDAEPEHERITVRELAEEQLHDLETGGPDCAPDLQRRLREAL